MKRIISLLLILVLVLGMIPAQAATAVKITKQPANATAAEGATAKVSLAAEGDGLTYTWYFKNKGASGFSKTSSFTGTTYSVKMDESRDGRQVYCVVTDKYGNTAQTNTVTLYMGNAVKITKQPADASAASGVAAKVSFTATGDGLTYTWYFKNKGASGFSKTTSFTGNVYSLQMNEARDGRQIYCVVTDKYGNTAKTNTVTLSLVNAVKITKQPQDVTVGNGETAKVSIAASGEGLTYEWFFKNKGASGFSKTNSFTGTVYSIKMDETRNGRQVYCVVTDKYGNTAKTNTATLYMGNAVKITKQPKSVTVASGETAKVSFTATGDGLTYEWYFKNKGASSFTKTTSFTGNVYSLQMNEARDGRQIYCVVTDKYGNTAKTNTVTLSLSAPLAITKQPVSTFAAVDTDVSFTVKATGGTAPLSYSWECSYCGGAWESIAPDAYWATGQSTPTLSFEVEGYDEYTDYRYRCVITDADGTSVTSNAVHALRPLIIIQQPAYFSVAEGEKATVSFEADGEGLTYEWYYKNKGASSFTKTTSFTSNIYSVKMDASRNGRQVYCVVTDKYGNSIKTNTVTLHIGEAVKITQQPVSTFAAVGTAVSFTVKATGGTAPLSYCWEIYFIDEAWESISPNSNWATGQRTPTLSFEVWDYDEYTDYRYRCVITDAEGASVITNAVHALCPLTIIQQPESVTVASGEKATVSFEAAGEGLTYEWYYKNKGASSFTKTTTFTSNTYSVKMDATRDGRQVYCMVTDKYGNSVKTNTVTLSMYPDLNITQQPADIRTGVGGTATFTVAVTGGLEPYTYQWQQNHAGNGWFDLTPDITWCKGSQTDTMYFSVETADEYKEGLYSYRCVITDAKGNSVTSDAACVLPPALKITQQPANYVAPVNGTAYFNVAVSGGTAPYSYQWMYSHNGGGWITVLEDAQWCSGQLTPNFSLEVEDENEYSIYSYCCLITDANHKVVTSDPARVLRPVEFKTLPSNTEVAVGDTATFTAEAQYGIEPYTYQWQYKHSNDSWKDLTDGDDWAYGINTETLSFVVESDMEYLDNYYSYRCVVTDANGDSVNTPAVRVHRPTPRITSQPKNACVAIGENATFTVVAEGGIAPLSYQWQYSVNGGSWNNITASTGWAEGGTTSTLYFTVESEEEYTDNYYVYRCVITDADGSSVISDVVRPCRPLTITKQPRYTTAGIGDTATFTVEATGGNGPYTYQWFYCYGATAWKSIPANAGWCTGQQTNQLTFEVRGNYEYDDQYRYKCAVTDANGNGETSVSVAVIKPLGFARQPQNASGAMGDTVTFTVKPDGGMGPYTYKWEYMAEYGSSWSTMSETSDTLTVDINSTMMVDYCFMYRCTITDTNDNTVTSDIAYLNK